MQMSRGMRRFFYCLALLPIFGVVEGLYLFIDPLIRYDRIKLAPLGFVVQSAVIAWVLIRIGRSGVMQATNTDISMDSPKLSKRETTKVFIGMMFALILLAAAITATIFAERSRERGKQLSPQVERVRLPPAAPYFD